MMVLGCDSRSMIIRRDCVKGACDGMKWRSMVMRSRYSTAVGALCV